MFSVVRTISSAISESGRACLVRPARYSIRFGRVAYLAHVTDHEDAPVIALAVHLERDTVPEDGCVELGTRHCAEDDVVTVDQDVTFARIDDAADDADQRRLARAIRPEKSMDLA